MKTIKITESDVLRFYSFVDKVSDPNRCWNWLGTKNVKQNRARFWVDGDTRTAAIISFIIHKGDIGDSLYVCHTCDNPLCVNPNHLFLGTHAENMIDMARKGRRLYKGENAPSHKLSNNDAREIRKLLLSGLSQRKIAKIYGVTQTAIGHINRNKTFVGVI